MLSFGNTLVSAVALDRRRPRPHVHVIYVVYTQCSMHSACPISAARDGRHQCTPGNSKPGRSYNRGVYGGGAALCSMLCPQEHLKAVLGSSRSTVRASVAAKGYQCSAMVQARSSCQVGFRAYSTGAPRGDDAPASDGAGSAAAGPRTACIAGGGLSGMTAALALHKQARLDASTPPNSPVLILAHLRGHPTLRRAFSFAGACQGLLAPPS